MDTTGIQQGDSEYPAVLKERLGENAPPCLYAMGSPSILRHRLLGLICSIQCPGSIVIQTFDAIRALRDAGIVVIGGFHSPMERECLDLLLRGNQPVILCPAKGLTRLRMGRTARQAIQDGRMLVLSPFAEAVRRTSAAHALQRNNLIAALADAVWVPHAAPGGKTWRTVRAALERQQMLFTFADDSNSELIAAGARPFTELDATSLADKKPLECQARNRQGTE